MKMCELAEETKLEKEGSVTTHNVTMRNAITHNVTIFCILFVFAIRASALTLSVPGGELIGPAKITDKIYVTAPDCVLRDIHVENGPGKGIVLEGAHRLVMDSVKVIGVGPDGAGNPSNDLVYAAVPSDGVRISNCTFDNSGRTHIIARGCKRWTIENSYFGFCESTPEQHSESMSLGGDGPPCENFTIRDCVFVGNEGTGCIVAMGFAFRIEGNLFLESVRHGNGTIAGWTGNAFDNSLFIHNTIVNLSLPPAAIFGIRIPKGIGNGAYHNLFLGALSAENAASVWLNTSFGGGNLFFGFFGPKSRENGNVLKPDGDISGAGLDGFYRPTVPLPILPGEPSFGRTTVGAFEYEPASATPMPIPTETATVTPTVSPTPTASPILSPTPVTLPTPIPLPGEVILRAYRAKDGTILWK